MEINCNHTHLVDVPHMLRVILLFAYAGNRFEIPLRIDSTRRCHCLPHEHHSSDSSFYK